MGFAQAELAMVSETRNYRLSSGTRALGNAAQPGMGQSLHCSRGSSDRSEIASSDRRDERVGQRACSAHNATKVKPTKDGSFGAPVRAGMGQQSMNTTLQENDMSSERRSKPVDQWDHMNAMGCGIGCILVTPFVIAIAVIFALIINAFFGAWAWIMLPVTIVAVPALWLWIFVSDSTWTREEALERGYEW